MRLTVVKSRHGKTTPDWCTHREAGATDRRHLNLGRVPATMSGGAAAGLVRGDARTNRERPRRWPCDRASPSGRLPQEPVGAAKPCPQLGRTPTVPAHAGGRRSVLKTVAGKRCRRESGGGFPDSSGAGATPWQTGQGFGELPFGDRKRAGQ